MTRYFFDCETDGLIPTLTKVHSLVLKEMDGGGDNGGLLSCHDHQPKASLTIEAGLVALMNADEIIGHNIINFDIPALQKVFPWFIPKGIITDTLVLSRLIFADMFDADLTKRKRASLGRPYPLPGKLTGSHGLKAWGYRLGFHKGDFGESTDWLEWTPEMQTYCELDVAVTEKLYHHIMGVGADARSILLEHQFATILTMQERHGFAFNEQGAFELYQTLVKRRLELSDQLMKAFPPKIVSTTFTPKVNNKLRGYVKDVTITKRDMVLFNPSSRQMIGDRLKEMGWQPEETTPSGQAKIDETILKKLPYPEAHLLAEHFLVEKRIGQLAEGDQAWLKLVRNGSLHGSVNPNGAVTGRCTHSRPNVAQVPSVRKNKAGDLLLGLEGGYGVECRSLFTVRPGYSLVGADLSGLELRCLAHFMALFDGGTYVKVLLEGDVHTVNQLAAGLPTRNDAKTFIYAFLYGAGDVKIGSIVAPMASEGEQAIIGKRLKASFLRKTPALKALREVVVDKAKRGYLIGLDGRKLHVRSAHAALNTLLQSAGALIAKQATVLAYQNLTASGYKWGKDFAMVAHVHDEMQFEVRQGLEEIVGQAVVNAMEEAGRHFGFKCPITGEFKFGSNWKETH